MNNPYFCRDFFLTDWRHKYLKNAIDLFLFYGWHFYRFSESEDETSRNSNPTTRARASRRMDWAVTFIQPPELETATARVQPRELKLATGENQLQLVFISLFIYLFNNSFKVDKFRKIQYIYIYIYIYTHTHKKIARQVG